MTQPESKKAVFFSEAIRFGKEASLRQIIDTLGISPDIYVLDQISLVLEELDRWGLSITPDISLGDIDCIRIIKSNINGSILQDDIDIEIQSYENSHLEFKGSLIFDIDKFTFNPGLPIREYRSEEVLHSSLKTIAAFLNCGGGILYIGVNNNGTISGLNQDCKILRCEEFNPDIWQLEIRNHVSSKFLQGKLINDYIDLDFHKRNGLSFARINILKREKLVFINKNSTSILYRRQGNRTVEVNIDEVEEFISFRKNQGWCK